MALAAELTALLGADRVKSHPLELHLYGKDAGVTRGEVEVVAFAETTEEVAQAVRLAARYGVPVVPRGAGTGLAGGAVPTEPALVLILTRMNRIYDVDPESRSAWVGPGVINLDLSRYTARYGLHFAPDPSSQSACTIGGNVATNAGGPHCLADGTTVVHVLGVELVTAEGDVLMLGSDAPDPIGLDLRGVVVGSEGTLGIVTRILVKLTPDPPAVRTLLLAFDSISDAAATVSDTIAAGVVPAALELMDQLTTRAVERFVSAGLPTEATALLLAEVTGHLAAVEAEAELISDIAEQHDATEIRIAQDEAERALYWKARKSAFGAVAQMAPDYYLHDTVVPRTRLVDVMDQVYEIGERYGLEMMNVFHAGDGNLHPLIPFDASDEAIFGAVQAAAEEIVDLSVAAGGALSGEHGIGLEKSHLMSRVFGPTDLEAQACLRAAFDPAGTLNPGKILPGGARCFDVDPPVSGEAV